MANIRFQFDREKAIQAIAYMAQLGLPELSKMKVCKLLYFADKRHLLAHGRPILGDSYACMDHGPVPSGSYNMMQEVAAHDPSDSAKLFTEFVGLNTTPKFPEFVAKQTADLDVFSPSEMQALQETIQELGQKTPYQLRAMSHEDAAWKEPDKVRTPGSSVPIPYELFFEDQPDDVRQILALVEAEQEDRDFAMNLAK